MKKFKFRLQGVLEYRERQRDTAKGELLKVNQKLQEAQAEKERLEQALLSNTLQIQGVALASEVLLNAQLAEGLSIRIKQQVEQISQIQEEVEKAMEAYREASKELRAVSILKERKLHDYNFKLAQIENSNLDEMAVMRAGRK